MNNVTATFGEQLGHYIKLGDIENIRLLSVAGNQRVDSLGSDTISSLFDENHFKMEEIVSCGNIDVFKVLLEDNRIESIGYSYLILININLDHFDIVELFLSHERYKDITLKASDMIYLNFLKNDCLRTKGIAMLMHYGKVKLTQDERLRYESMLGG